MLCLIGGENEAFVNRRVNKWMTIGKSNYRPFVSFTQSGKLS